MDENEEILDDNCDVIHSAHSDKSKNSKLSRNATQSNEKKAHSTVNSTKIQATKSDDNSKNSKLSRKATQSNEKKVDSTVNSTKKPATKSDDNSEKSKPIRSTTQSREPQSKSSSKLSTVEHMMGTGVITRSQAKKVLNKIN